MPYVVPYVISALCSGVVAWWVTKDPEMEENGMPFDYREWVFRFIILFYLMNIAARVGFSGFPLG